MKIDPRSSVGDVLRSARLAIGMTQGDLARRIGVGQDVLNKVEHHKRRFDTDWVELMPPSIRSAVKAALFREARSIPVFRRAEDEDQDQVTELRASS